MSETDDPASDQASVHAHAPTAHEPQALRRETLGEYAARLMAEALRELEGKPKADLRAIIAVHEAELDDDD
jgi:hypothetical protein